MSTIFLYLAFSLYILLFCCISQRTDYRSSINQALPFDTTNAIWLSPIYCSDNKWAIGFNVYSSCSSLGTISIAMYCGSINMNSIENKTYPIDANFVGSWNRDKYCSGVNFFTGYLALGDCCIYADNLAMNDLTMICSSGEQLNSGGGCLDGSWTSKTYCPSSTAICGFSLKYVSYIGLLGDNTAINDIKFHCCLICKSSSSMYADNSDYSYCHFCNDNCLTCSGLSNNCTSCAGLDTLNTGSCLQMSNYAQLGALFFDEVTPGAFSNDLNTGGWVASSGETSQTCGSWKMIGKFKKGSSFTYSKNNIYPHYRVRLRARIYKIDQWFAERVIVKINGNDLNLNDLVFSSSQDALYFGNLCNDASYPEYTTTFDVEALDISTNLLIEFTSSLNQLFGFWGIAHLYWGIYKCDPTCLTCLGPDSTDCLTCYSGGVLSLTGSCSCIDTYFADTVNEDFPKIKCTACSLGCKTCSNVLSTSCSVCISGYFLSGTQCVTSCPLSKWGQSKTGTCDNACAIDEYGNILNNRICESCDETCNTCVDTSSKCTSCSGIRFLDQSSCVLNCSIPYFGVYLTNLCEEYCPPNQYLNFYDRTCYLLCPINYFADYISQNCVITCPSGYYGDSSDRKCKNCPLNCTICTSSQCQTCKYAWQSAPSCDNTLPTWQEFIEAWTNDNYQAYTDNYITSLGWNILNIGPTTTLMNFCGSLFIYGGDQVFVSQTKVTKNFANIEAYPHYNIRIIFSFIQIDTWSNNKLFVKVDGNIVLTYSIPDSNMIYTNITRYCGDSLQPEAIHIIDLVFAHNTTSLYFEISTDLLVSNPITASWGIYNFYLIAYRCDINCLECLSAESNQCTKCNLDRFLQVPPGPSTCLSICPDGYYSNPTNNYCVLCDSSCKTCSGLGANNCLTCLRTQYLLKNNENFSCVTDCPNYYYKDNSTLMCLPCDTSCQTCKGMTYQDCLTCPFSRYLRNYQCYDRCPQGSYGILDTYVCVTTCPDGTYPNYNTGSCAPCDEKCLLCIGPGNDECYQCNGSYVLQETSCISNCSSNYSLETESNICRSCADNCKICSSLTTCSECNDNLYVLRPENSSCVDCLGSGQFSDNSQKMCFACVKYCETCINSTACSACQKGYFLNTPFDCITQRKLTGYIYLSMNPQKILLYFSDYWEYLATNLYNISTIKISDLNENSDFTYNIYNDDINRNLMIILFDFKTKVGFYNVLSVEINHQDSEDEDFLLLNKTFEIPLFNFCPLPLTYSSTLEACVNATFIYPTFTYTTKANVLSLKFSSNFGEIYAANKNYSTITVQNYDSALKSSNIQQLNTIDDFFVVLSFSTSVTGYPVLTLSLNLPDECIFNTSNNYKIQINQFNITLKDQYMLDSSTESLINGAQETTSQINTITSNTFVANNILTSGASFAFRCMVCMDTIRYLRYFTIDYPPNAVAIFETQFPTADFVPNIELTEDPLDGTPLDIKFLNEGASDYIFNNCGNILIELSVYVLIGYLASFIAKFFLKRVRNKFLKILFIIPKSIFVWNYSISNALSSFMNYVFYTFLSYRYPVQTTHIGKFNKAFSIFMGICIPLVFFLIFYQIQKLRKFNIEKELLAQEQKKNNDFEKDKIVKIPTKKASKIKSNKIYCESVINHRNNEIEMIKPPSSQNELVSPYEPLSVLTSPTLNKVSKTVSMTEILSPTKENLMSKKSIDIANSLAISSNYFDKNKEETRADFSEFKIEEDPKNKISFQAKNEVDFDKKSASRLKKKDIILEKIIQMEHNKLFKTKIRDYFKNLRANLLNLKHSKDYLMDWRVNEDYNKSAENQALFLYMEDFNKNFNALHKDYNQKGFFQSIFILIDLTRQLIFSLIIVMLFNIPFVGLILIILLNVAFVITFIIVKPFKEVIDNIQAFINECVLMSVCICSFILALMEHYDINDSDVKLRIGWVIVFCNVILIVIFLMRMTWNIIKFLYAITKLIFRLLAKAFKKRNRVDIFKENTIGTRKKSMAPRNFQNLEEVEKYLG